MFPGCCIRVYHTATCERVPRNTVYTCCGSKNRQLLDAEKVVMRLPLRISNSEAVLCKTTIASYIVKLCVQNVLTRMIYIHCKIYLVSWFMQTQKFTTISTVWPCVCGEQLVLLVSLTQLVCKSVGLSISLTNIYWQVTWTSDLDGFVIYSHNVN